MLLSLILDVCFSCLRACEFYGAEKWRFDASSTVVEQKNPMICTKIKRLFELNVQYYSYAVAMVEFVSFGC